MLRHIAIYGHLISEISITSSCGLLPGQEEPGPFTLYKAKGANLTGSVIPRDTDHVDDAFPGEPGHIQFGGQDFLFPAGNGHVEGLFVLGENRDIIHIENNTAFDIRCPPQLIAQINGGVCGDVVDTALAVMRSGVYITSAVKASTKILL